TDVSELCGSAVSLAQQLTHIELERLSYIGPEEFVQAFAKESPSSEPRITHNYEIYCDWFPRLASLVLTDVCRQMKSKKYRVKVLEFWIETARECFNIGNFNSLMAIIAGLNKTPVSRLKKTWSLVDRTELSRLEREVSFYDDYCSYRTALRSAASKFNKGDPEHCIVVPLFSLLASDLHTLCQECLTILPNGHINFEKFWQLAKQVTEFITWKQVHCPFSKSPKVITFLQATPVLNEDASMLASFDCEHPETPEELEFHKKLLAEVHNS
ncbi:ras-GEF domain-containing family member 1B, partial [Halyomorpha halys]|uniref:ras-GEF domain-containing family member 1B n=1 Tax=Halyomorpha halys TaxID=286706 RepID=UPI000D0C75F8